MLPPAVLKSPFILAREFTEPARMRLSPATEAPRMTEPPHAKKSPSTGAVSTTEAPAAYKFPGDELVATSDCAAENDAGADTAEALAGMKQVTRIAKRMLLMKRLSRRRHREMM